MKTNIIKKDNFNQVCVWPSTIVSECDVQKFEEFFKEMFEVRVQFLEEYKTQPDRIDFICVYGTGGRSDVLFAIHDEDVSKFVTTRLSYGIRWLEDALDNSPEIYESRIHRYGE